MLNSVGALFMAMSFRLFEDGTYYILYNPANLGSIGDGHVIQGSGTAASGVFTSSDAMLYPASNVPFSGAAASAAKLAGTYVPPRNLALLNIIWDGGELPIGRRTPWPPQSACTPSSDCPWPYAPPAQPVVRGCAASARSSRDD